MGFRAVISVRIVTRLVKHISPRKFNKDIWRKLMRSIDRPRPKIHGSKVFHMCFQEYFAISCHDISMYVAPWMVITGLLFRYYSCKKKSSCPVNESSLTDRFHPTKHDEIMKDEPHMPNRSEPRARPGANGPFACSTGSCIGGAAN